MTECVDGVVELVEEVEDFVDEGFIVWNQRLGDGEVIVFELLSQFGILNFEFRIGRDEFLQEIGGLTHGGDDDHQRLC